MAAILVYLPEGKLNKWRYEGGLQLVEEVKRLFGGQITVLEMIETNHGIVEQENDAEKEIANRFVSLVQEEKNVIMMIKAMDPKEAFYKLLSLVPDPHKALHPKRVIIVSASERPKTDEEWKSTLNWTVSLIQNRINDNQSVMS